MTLKDEVRTLVSEHADVGADEDRLDVDSLTLVTIIEALEERFDVRVAPRDAVPENFASVAAITRFLEAKRP